MTKIRINFEDMGNAYKALAIIKDMGYKGAHLDMVENFSEEFGEEISDIKNLPSLSSIVLHGSSGFRDIHKARLVAANPMVSGVGSHCEIARNPATTLIVNVEEEKMQDIKNLLRELGGSFRNCT